MESSRQAIIETRKFFEEVNSLWHISKRLDRKLLVQIVQPAHFRICKGNLNYPLLNFTRINDDLDSMNSDQDEKNVKLLKKELLNNIEQYKKILPAINKIDFEELMNEEQERLSAQLISEKITAAQANIVAEKLQDIEIKIGVNWFEIINLAAIQFLHLINRYLPEAQDVDISLKNCIKLKFDEIIHCYDFFRQAKKEGHISNSFQEIGEFIYENIEFNKGTKPKKQNIVTELKRDKPPKKNRTIYGNS